MKSLFSPTRRTLLAGAAALALLPETAIASPSARAPVLEDYKPGDFPLIRSGKPASVLIDSSCDPAVVHAAGNFAADLQRVSGVAAAQYTDPAGVRGPVVVIGVVGHSPLIDALVAKGRIDARDIAGEWEAFRQITIDQPWPGVPQALVIVGSDRRGAVFGTYDISEKMGVSPWHWFADVPVRRRTDLFFASGSRGDQPRVRYRGFFINDEDPCFSGWAKKHFGGINSAMYAQVFELLLRLKGNYLWPAMWAPKAFNDDDPQNKVLADAMGVVMGTSHHEPLTRAQNEWHRNTAQGVTGGAWDYETNTANLRTFWRGGIDRMISKGDGKGYECLLTIGMRGDGDEAMTGGSPALMERIVADQRQIISEGTGRPAEQSPQVWALYKEVQDYYDQGMRAPDDVTLLFADDNWGQLRRLPAPGSAPRKGGYGIYYHFDYVGVPRNYKWLNTNQIEKTWQQMDLAYAAGVRNIWVVNVGDIKPMEYPLSFFMAQAWNPQAMTPAALAAWPEEWARLTFGPDHAAMIAELITRYSQLAARRKPELVDANAFRLGDGLDVQRDGGEFGAMVEDWAQLERRMTLVKAMMPATAHPAFFQLIEHPISAMSTIYQLQYAVAWNRRLAAAGDARANDFADRAAAAFKRDSMLTEAYHALNDGKWDGMMAQVHIGYKSWNDPKTQEMPEVTRVAATGGTDRPVSFAPAVTRPGTTNGQIIAIEAPDYSRAVGAKGLTWTKIAHLGRTSGAVLALPQGRPATVVQDGVRLEYDVTLDRPGDLDVQLYKIPTLDPTGSATQRLGLSIDDGKVVVLTDRLVPAPGATRTQEQRDWNKAVVDNARLLTHRFPGVAAGRHTIKIWRLDDNVVLQKLVASTGAVPASYLGPPSRSEIARRRGRSDA